SSTTSRPRPCRGRGPASGTACATARSLLSPSCSTPARSRRCSRRARGSERSVAVLTRSQVIGRPIGEVFDTIVDGGNFAAWNPTIRSSRRLDTGEVGEGTRFEWDLRGFGKVVQELQEFQRPVTVRIVPHIKTLEGGHRFRLTEEGNGTRINHELEMRPNR